MDAPWNLSKKPEYQKQEERAARKPGARKQVNSGRLWSSLRDVMQDTPLGKLLIDNKTGKDGPLKSYRLTEDEWDKLKRDANRTPPGCYPGLQIDLGKHRLIVVEEKLLDDAMEHLGRVLKP